VPPFEPLPSVQANVLVTGARNLAFSPILRGTISSCLAGAAASSLACHNCQKEGQKGKQDKGSVSRPLPSVCLNILFSRDKQYGARDCPNKNGERPPFLARNRETQAHFDA
jgi:hypothetical protein